MEDRALDSEELREFGIMVSGHRKQLREYGLEYDTAVAEATDVAVHQVSSLGLRMEKGYFGLSTAPTIVQSSLIEEPTPPGLRLRGKRRPNLQLNDKVWICHLALVDQESYQDIAKKFRASIGVVGHIVMKMKRNKNYLSLLLKANDDRLRRREVVAAYVAGLN